MAIFSFLPLLINATYTGQAQQALRGLQLQQTPRRWRPAMTKCLPGNRPRPRVGTALQDLRD